MEREQRDRGGSTLSLASATPARPPLAPPSFLPLPREYRSRSLGCAAAEKYEIATIPGKKAPSSPAANLMLFSLQPSSPPPAPFFNRNYFFSRTLSSLFPPSLANRSIENSRQDLQEASPSVREGAPRRRAQARRRVWPPQQARALARADGAVQDPTGTVDRVLFFFRRGA
jgi:hypothetical protein